MRDALLKALLSKGFPAELCEMMLTHYLNTDYTQTRMLGYLYRYENPTVEEAVDEMLAIVSDRDALRNKKIMEENQARINEIYQRGLGVEEEE